MLKFIPVTLESLCGERVLDAVDKYLEQASKWNGVEDANAIRFRLDGAVYTAIEDPDDGYRSTLGELFVTLDVKMVNVFPPVKVLGRIKTKNKYDNESNILEFVDITTEAVVLEVGTDNQDDYYPSFVGSFSPENMVTNAKIECPKDPE